MVERAFAWAESNKKSRINAIHGEPEAFLLLADGFEITVMDVEENEQEGNIEVQEPRVIKHTVHVRYHSKNKTSHY